MEAHSVVGPVVGLPLVGQLSAAHVAFTIELDNAAEARMAHQTTAGQRRGEARRGPWLTSVAMYDTCLRWLVDGEATVAEVRERARTRTNLDGVRRWGYVTIDGRGAGDGRQTAAPASVLALTRSGARACEVWQALDDEIERRWRARFGAGAVDRLRDALQAVLDGADELAQLPDTLPILGHGLFSEVGDLSPAPPRPGLRALLARVLLGLIVDYERAVKLSLPVAVNTLRLLDGDGGRVSDLPRLSGVSKEAHAMALGLLERAACVEVWSAQRRRMVRLSDRGANARRRALQRVRDREGRWCTRVGSACIDELRAAVGAVAGDGTRAGSPLFAGLQPLEGAWRAQARSPERLPWCPMVLHRGGWPDGA
jgi:hypothetical protein